MSCPEFEKHFWHGFSGALAWFVPEYAVKTELEPLD